MEVCNLVGKCKNQQTDGQTDIFQDSGNKYQDTDLD